uniref:Uncharacterized protein n=1 Tax=Strongyloides venezuelensis TaxID=75913 RepID=A0A0K0FAX2_STRVS
MRCTRSSGLIQHLKMHPQDGLGLIFLVKFLYDNLCLPGGTHNESIATKNENYRDIAEYFWVRGQLLLCAPAELINLSGSYLMKFNCFKFNKEIICFGSNHLPTQNKILNDVVDFLVSAPMRGADGSIAGTVFTVKRER